MTVSSRREFLGAGLAAAAALVGVRLPVPTSTRVIVVGAGLAGLSAAHALVDAGLDVTVLEAQARSGGRVRTLRQGWADGQYAEAGAARIPDNHWLTIGYARRFGLRLVPFRPEEGEELWDLAGQRVRVPASGEPDLRKLPLSFSQEERRLDYGGLWERYVSPALASIGDPQSGAWPPPRLRRLDQETFAQFLVRRGASAGAIALLELPFYRPEQDKVSALWWLREIALGAGARTRFKIAGGNDQLPRALADRLGRRIRYGMPVWSIRRRDRGLTVRAGEDGEQELEADYLVVAIPFTLLRNMEIDPPLSPGKQRAIAHLPYESAVRVMVQLAGRPWEAEGLSGFGLTDHPEEIWHPTFDRPGPRGILQSYLSGPAARELVGLDDSRRVSDVVQRLERLFPGIDDRVLRSSVVDWDADPWARGAYSVLSPEQGYDLLPHLARPEGRIHFAGEHTSPWPGWMQGALHSGRRVAQEIGVAIAWSAGRHG